MENARILAIYGHPDDEGQVTGTLARFIRHGAKATLVCATRGEVGEISDPHNVDFQTTVDDFTPKPMPMTAESRAIYEGREFGDDHVLRCMPAGLPRIFGSPYSMEILDAGTHYLVLSLQDNTPRWVTPSSVTAPVKLYWGRK